MANITRVGVDIAKSIFHVHGVDRFEKTQWKGKYSRKKWIDALEKKVPKEAVIAMEACGSAHYWGRELNKRGFTVKLIHPKFVKPYVKSNKNDAVDAEAICEAMARPNMRFVQIKTVQQQDVQSAHRIREKLMQQRTAKVNHIRGLVAEYGVIAPVGIKNLREAIPTWLVDAESHLSAIFRQLLSGLADDLSYIDNRIDELNLIIKQHVETDAVASQLVEVRGVGVLCASALTSAIGDGKAYRKGRDFAASLGLTPRQHSTGGKDRLLGISKRGDGYLRKLLVHGARAVIRHAKDKNDYLSKWLNKLLKTKHVNIVTVALANKIARIAWAMVAGDKRYQPNLAANLTA